MNKEENIIDIAEVLTNFKETTPEVNKLVNYVNQILIIQSFEVVDTPHKNKDGSPKETIAIVFEDEMKNTRRIITSSKYIVNQLKMIAAENIRFNSTDINNRLFVKVKLSADIIFGEYRNFYFTTTKWG